MTIGHRRVSTPARFDNLTNNKKPPKPKTSLPQECQQVVLNPETLRMVQSQDQSATSGQRGKTCTVITNGNYLVLHFNYNQKKMDTFNYKNGKSADKSAQLVKQRNIAPDCAVN